MRLKKQIYGDKLRPKWLEKTEDLSGDMIINLKSPILDIGAGISSRFRQNLTNEKYIRLDIDDSEEPDIVGDALSLPIKSESLNGVIYADILEHLINPFEAIREARRVIKPGGKIYVSVPFLYPYHPHPKDYYRFTLAGLKELLEKEGFCVEEIKPHTSGVFSCINRWAIAWTYDKPYLLRIFIQPLLYVFRKFFSFLDLGRDRFYIGVYCLAKKI